MLRIVDGKLLNSREVGTAVANLLMQGTPIDQICEIQGMPSATQIAYLRRADAAFSEAMTIALEAAGLECAMILLKGARDGDINKNQVEAAKWVAERAAPELFMERKEIQTKERDLTDAELMFQLEAAARSDERVKRLLEANNPTIGMNPVKKDLRKFVSRRRETRKIPRAIDVVPEEESK